MTVRDQLRHRMRLANKEENFMSLRDASDRETATHDSVIMQRVHRDIHTHIHIAILYEARVIRGPAGLETRQHLFKCVAHVRVIKARVVVVRSLRYYATKL